MNIFIITRDEPFYLPRFFERVMSYFKSEIVGIAILSEGKSKVKTLRKYLKFYGLGLFCIQLFLYFICKLSDKLSYVLPVKNLHSVERISQKYKIQIFDTININSKEFIDKLKELKVDLVVSVTSPQTFKTELLSTPKLGCINVHGAPLPRYRGVLPSFWMLFNKEKKGAVTVHYMEEELDSGDIILQRGYDIRPDVTHHELIIESKRIGAEVLIEAIEIIRSGNIMRKQNDVTQATYYSFPKKEDIKKFHLAGGKLR